MSDARLYRFGGLDLEDGVVMTPEETATLAQEARDMGVSANQQGFLVVGELMLKLAVAIERQSQELVDADLLLGPRWQEALKATHRQPHDAIHFQVTKLAGDVEILKEQLAAAQQDSARLDWLEKHGGYEWGDHGDSGNYAMRCIDFNYFINKPLRQAIDEAIAETPLEEPTHE